MRSKSQKHDVSLPVANLFSVATHKIDTLYSDIFVTLGPKYQSFSSVDGIK